MGRDWPLMSLILTTPMRTTPAVFGAMAGAAGGGGGVGSAFGAGAPATGEPTGAGAPPIMVDMSVAWQPGGISNRDASSEALVSSTTSVVVVNVPCCEIMVVVCLRG